MKFYRRIASSLFSKFQIMYDLFPFVTDMMDQTLATSRFVVVINVAVIKKKHNIHWYMSEKLLTLADCLCNFSFYLANFQIHLRNMEKICNVGNKRHPFDPPRPSILCISQQPHQRALGRQLEKINTPSRKTSLTRKHGKHRSDPRETFSRRARAQ